MTVTPRGNAPPLTVVLGIVIGLLLGPLGGTGQAREGGTPSPVAATPIPYAAGVDLATLDGTVSVDGSSTVWLISAEVAERFVGMTGDVEAPVAISGTGGGFRRFCAGETDIQGASRPISAEEAAACAAAGVTHYGFEIAYDGITVVVNPANDFVQCLTVEQLRRLWMPDDPARTWRDLDPAWPDEEIELYGPGIASGTFDSFTTEIVGERGASRQDYILSENDNVLVQGVADEEQSLGYFGFAYYVETQDRLRAVAIDAGAGCVAPSRETIADGSYRPLSRPLYVYVSGESLARPEVRELMRFYLATAKESSESVGYVATDDATYAANQAKLDGAIAGAVVPDGSGAPGTPATR